MDTTEEVKTLTEKAAKAETSLEAMQFSQAALSVAHAMAVLSEIKGK